MPNVALHGLEEAAGVRYRDGDYADRARDDSPVAVRYADDFVTCCFTRQQAEGVRERLKGWLAERGLSLNQDKTRVVHLTEGFDFLSWTFRRYPSGKLLIKPSKAAIRKHRRRLASEMRRLRGSNARAVIASLNPVIRGWAAYHRGMVSSEVFNSLGAYMWKLTWKWARHSHPNKPGKPGSRPGTSARSTRSGKTRGCSATGKPAATCASTAGRGYAATSWSRAGHPPTTRTWQATAEPPGQARHPAGHRRHEPAQQATGLLPAVRGPAVLATCPIPPRNGTTGGWKSPSGPSSAHPARPASSPAPEAAPSLIHASCWWALTARQRAGARHWTFNAHGGACLSRVMPPVARTVPEGAGAAAMRPGYPTLRAWRAGGVDGLRPSPRSDTGKVRAMPELFGEAAALRLELPGRSAAQIASILYHRHGVRVAERTVSGQLRRAGLHRAALKAAPKAYGPI